MIVITRTTVHVAAVWLEATKRGIQLTSYSDDPGYNHWWLTDDSNYDAIVKWFAESDIITFYSATKKEQTNG